MKLLVIAAMTSLLAGCATTGKFQAVMNSWIGAPAQAIVDAWGYPAQQMTAPDGNTVYLYQRSGDVALPATTYTNATYTQVGNQGFGNAYSTTYGGGAIHLQCNVAVEINSAKTIVGWHAQGNSCKSR